MSHPIVDEAAWTAARRELLQKEKALTRLHDEVAAARLALPWRRLDKVYVFDGPNGLETLEELFGGRSQLIVYHFMFGPDWEEGCPGCSFLCDHIDGANLHLSHHDVTLLAASRAPYEKIAAYKERMGWGFKWVSSLDSDFNYDFGASYRQEDLEAGDVFHNFSMQRLRFQEQPGVSVFFRDTDGTLYHTYSAYERGGEAFLGAYAWLDIAPKGRNEETPMDWMRHHDRYEEANP